MNIPYIPMITEFIQSMFTNSKEWEKKQNEKLVNEYYSGVKMYESKEKEREEG